MKTVERTLGLHTYYGFLKFGEYLLCVELHHSKMSPVIKLLSPPSIKKTTFCSLPFSPPTLKAKSMKMIGTFSWPHYSSLHAVSDHVRYCVVPFIYTARSK